MKLLSSLFMGMKRKMVFAFTQVVTWVVVEEKKKTYWKCPVPVRGIIYSLNEMITDRPSNAM